jgi:hypothetical protein
VTADNVLVLAGLALVGILAVAKGQIPLNRWSLLPLALAGAIFVTGIVNGYPNWEACLRFVSLATIPWVVGHDPKKRESNTTILVAVMTVGALSVLAQPIIGYPLPYKDTENTGLRFGGFFGHPNFAAYALALSVLYVISLRLTLPRILFLAIAGGALLATGSMTALLVLVACMGLVLARSVKRLVAAIAVAAVFLALAGQTLLSRLDFAAATAGGAAADSNSGAWRLGQWNRALRLLEGSESAGIGWGEIPLRVGNGLGAHNAYVQLVVELGWAATVALAFIVVGSVLMSRTRHVLLIVWGYVLLTSMGDPVLFYPSSMTVLLFILAACSGAPRGWLLGVRRHREARGRGSALKDQKPRSTPKHRERGRHFSPV